jgi:hypothetical protein
MTSKPLIKVNPYSDLPEMAGKRWYRGNFHNHTRSSTRMNDPEFIKQSYRVAGFDFVGMSDHHGLQTHHGYLDDCMFDEPGVFVVAKGSEVFLRDRLCGMCEYNCIGYIPPDVPDVNTEGLVDKVHAAGKVAYLCHPAKWNDKADVIYEDPEARKLDGIELLNVAQACQDDSPVESNPGFAIRLWDACLTQGLRFWGFTGSDWHGGKDVPAMGKPFCAYNRVLMDSLTEEALIDSLKKGRFYVSSGIELNSLSVEDDTISVCAWNATQLRFIGKGGAVLETVQGNEGSYRVHGDEMYVRVEFSNEIPALPNASFPQMAWLQPFHL